MKEWWWIETEELCVKSKITKEGRSAIEVVAKHLLHLLRDLMIAVRIFIIINPGDLSHAEK